MKLIACSDLTITIETNIPISLKNDYYYDILRLRFHNSIISATLFPQKTHWRSFAFPTVKYCIM